MRLSTEESASIPPDAGGKAVPKLNLYVHSTAWRSPANRSDIDDQGSAIAIGIVHLLDLGSELEDLIADSGVVFDPADALDDQGASSATVPVEEGKLRVRRKCTIQAALGTT